MKRFLILAGGHIDHEYLKGYLKNEYFHQVVCADGGLQTAQELGIKVDYIVGDFDSISSQVLESYRVQEKQGKVQIREYLPEKDMTDTDIAMDLAMEKGAEEMFLFGVTGTRLDHTLANIHLLRKPLSRGIRAYIMNENNKIYLLDASIKLTKENLFGKYVSLLPFTEKVVGVTLKGFRYPLKDYCLSIGQSLAVSNEVQERIAVITIKSGILIVVESRD